MANLSKKNQEQLVTAGILLGAGYVVLHYGGDAIKKFLESLNPFGDPQATSQIDDAASDVKSPFSPAFIRNAPVGSAILTDFQVRTHIQSLLDAVDNVFAYSNDFAKVLSVFKSMKTQSQVSYLADKFSQAVHQDLLSWLRNQTLFSHNFSDSQVQQILNYVYGLPKYKA